MPPLGTSFDLRPDASSIKIRARCSDFYPGVSVRLSQVDRHLHKDAAALLIFGGDEPDQDSLDEEDSARGQSRMARRKATFRGDSSDGFGVARCAFDDGVW